MPNKENKHDNHNNSKQYFLKKLINTNHKFNLLLLFLTSFNKISLNSISEAIVKSLLFLCWLLIQCRLPKNSSAYLFISWFWRKFKRFLNLNFFSPKNCYNCSSLMTFSSIGSDRVWMHSAINSYNNFPKKDANSSLGYIELWVL